MSKAYDGNTSKATKALHGAAQMMYKKGTYIATERGDLEGRVMIEGITVTITGWEVNGVFRIGTAFGQ